MDSEYIIHINFNEIKAEIDKLEYGDASARLSREFVGWQSQNMDTYSNRDE